VDEWEDEVAAHDVEPEDDSSDNGYRHHDAA
jgi:hypothetical protein